MNKNKKIAYYILFLAIFAVVYFPLDTFLKKAFDSSQEGIVKRAVDGDTIELQTGEKVRLLGINTPEKGEEYSLEAKEFLEKELLNKSVVLRFGKEKADLYNRTLAYVFVEKENINQKIISKGFANAYFPSGKDAYSESFLREWENCVNNNINYCEKSKNICAQCIALKELSCTEQKIILRNICGIKCDLTSWQIKDEGRKKFVFPEFVLEPNNEIEVVVGKNHSDKDFIWEKETYVWTETGDTAFLRDEKNKIVFWKNY